jgi:ribonucleoside-diphosphate reductase alpha chain
MQKYGRRNIALLTTAPTGSVSILTQTTSGIEPLFKLEPYIRRRKLTDNVIDKPDFVDKIGDKWKNYEVWHTKIKDWMDISGETDVKKSPWYNSCANDLDWKNRIRIQSVAQKHVCHSISSTINLPNNTTKEIIEQIYTQAFQSGCKGITIYREGCRDGVLISKEKIERPRELQCDVHHITSKGQKFFVLVGKREDGSPYEIFAGLNNILDGAIKSGVIIKKKKNFYKAVFDNGDELSPVTNTMTDIQEAVSRLCSLLLRNKVDIHTIVSQLERIGESRDLQCFSACLARALKKYIPDGTKEGEQCPECGNSSIIRQSGCKTCVNNECNWSACS